MKVKKIQLLLESKNNCYVEETETANELYFYSWANNPSMADIKELASDEGDIRSLFD